MIPNTDILTEEITETTYGGRTYKINFADNITPESKLGLTGNNDLTIISKDKLSGFTIDENGVVSISYNTTLSGCELSQDSNGILGLTMSADLQGLDRISGYIDGLESIIQAVYLILSTERYKHIIYSWDYGIEMVDLIGKPMPYVYAELPRRITEALTMDDRIDDVIDFEFEQNRSNLHVTFTIQTNLGNIATALEVAI